jgi:hypothetical protein
MIQVGTYLTRSDAEIAQTALNRAGIGSVLESDDAEGVHPFSLKDGVRLLVNSGDAQDAAAVLHYGSATGELHPPVLLDVGSGHTHRPLSKARRLDAEAAEGMMCATPFISIARVGFAVSLVLLVLLPIVKNRQAVEPRQMPYRKE